MGLHYSEGATRRCTELKTVLLVSIVAALRMLIAGLLHICVLLVLGHSASPTLKGLCSHSLPSSSEFWPWEESRGQVLTKIVH